MALTLSIGSFALPAARAVVVEDSGPSGNPAPGSPAADTAKGADNQEADAENGQFRHARPVKAIARTLNVSTEVAAQIFEDLNSAILILVILFFLARAVPKAIRSRTATIQKQLIDARSATEIANERLTAVETKLARLGEDIDAIRKQTDRDIVEDEKRIKQALEEERVRIVKAAEQEIESAGTAAQRELKRFAAELAIDKAAKRIQLTAETDKALVQRFGRELAGQFGKGGQN
ncbi:ATP synthase F0 sector subunit b [Acidisarcina polymorpha]|uniref:ATP synthase subunit b n=1 Tax=Acidisarcina polymorpha TaxID=2211140 RepID=A0A2Z5FXC0_9BACT|nr:ATP synthase F0 sector subunit b [Acidisarcina polymorpha]